MAIVRKDKLASGYHGVLESVKIHSGAGAKISSTNGVFVKVEGLLTGERETKKATLADLDDVALDVYFIHNSEIMYDERLSKLADFYIQENKVARAYALNTGDILTLTLDLFVGTPTVGAKLVVHTDGKIGYDLTALATAKYVFEVIEDSGYELDPEMKAFAVQVTRK